MLVEGEKGQKTGFVWVHASNAKIVFEFTLGRGRDGPTRLLKGLHAYFVADGYSGYDEIEERHHPRGLSFAPRRAH